MPTKNPRINITFEEHIAQLIAKLAKKQQKSVSGFAKELILEALERREDAALSAFSDEREIKESELVDHDDAWN